MAMEWTYFAPGNEPEVLTANLCDGYFEGKHEDCPGHSKYDPQGMESWKAKEGDMVFCICACHKKPQA